MRPMIVLLIIGIVAVGFILIEQNGGSNPVARAGDYLASGIGSLEGDVVDTGVSAQDLDVMTRTIIGEAANQTAAAQQGVASVIWNRTKDFTRNKYAGSVSATCKAPGQFDCWRQSSGQDFVMTTTTPSDAPIYQQCMQIAQGVTSGDLADNTDGAYFYHDSRLGGPPASWGPVEKTAQIDDLTFYRPQ